MQGELDALCLSAGGSAADVGGTVPGADQAMPMDEDDLLQQALAMSMQVRPDATPRMLSSPS